MSLCVFILASKKLLYTHLQYFSNHGMLSASRQALSEATRSSRLSWSCSAYSFNSAVSTSSLQPFVTSVLRTCSCRCRKTTQHHRKSLWENSHHSMCNYISCYCIYLFQVSDQEFLALQHFLLVTLCQMVEICKLMERRMAACEWRRSR